jgi:hypothetical protein
MGPFLVLGCRIGRHASLYPLGSSVTHPGHAQTGFLVCTPTDLAFLNNLFPGRLKSDDP